MSDAAAEGRPALALVGCGHIGGSLALALRAAGAVSRVVGVDADAKAAARARERGFVDEVAASVGDAVAAVAGGLVVLAVPVRAIVALVGDVAAAAHAGAVVTDVGSLKAAVVAAGEAALGGRFVGSHPMAGTERSGPDAADAALFGGKAAIVTPTARTDAAACARVEAMWRAAGAARVVRMAPDAHDAAMAGLSHLPHVVAYALAGALAADAPGWSGLAGGSVASGTRVAGSDPAMWSALLLENREPVLAWIARFAASLDGLRAAIEAGDEAALEARLVEGRAARAALVGA